MKSVLISIRPEWCKKIASGEKTIEVRRTRPKLETPFKCYVYMTYGKTPKVISLPTENGFRDYPIHAVHPECVNGKVIGEFVCDCVVDMGKQYAYARKDKAFYEILRSSCLNEKDLQKYAPKGKAFAWHISDLKIYDTPKELGEFWAYNAEWHERFEDGEDFCRCDDTNEYGELLNECAAFIENARIENCYRCWEEWNGWCHRVKHPPQSWCYVEEIEL